MKIRFTAVFILLSCHIYAQSPVSHDTCMNLLAGMWYEVALYPSELRNNCHCTTLEFEYIQGKPFATMYVRCIQFKNEKSRILESRQKLFASADSSGYFLREGRYSREYYRIVQVTNDNSIIAFYKSRRNHLHLLSRDSYVPVHKFNGILKLLSQKGYNSASLQKTSQNCDIIE